jgi:MtN3 and saliva related transmembrane protein
MNCSIFPGIENNENCVKDISAFVFGLMSGMLAWGLLIPQIVKGYKTKSLKDYSKKTLALLATCHSFMIIYGALIFQIPILINAPVALSMTLTLITMKSIYEKNEQHTQNEQTTEEINKGINDV